MIFNGQLFFLFQMFMALGEHLLPTKIINCVQLIHQNFSCQHAVQMLNLKNALRSDPPNDFRPWCGDIRKTVLIISLKSPS